ncbi:putative valine--tRNA ligase [Rosa chinensis]|uniref:valine--tRNA ligase n=1 Tax=Rosa chinensis TaxID=74649 RepID=A0A2P6S087_ROSCH|nr:putative valine--tRNA ligase [Rosa chinensis]
MGNEALNAVADDENRKLEIIPRQYTAEWKRGYLLKKWKCEHVYLFTCFALCNHRWLCNISDWCVSRQLWWSHSVLARYVVF